MVISSQLLFVFRAVACGFAVHFRTIYESHIRSFARISFSCALFFPVAESCVCEFCKYMYLNIHIFISSWLCLCVPHVVDYSAMFVFLNLIHKNFRHHAPVPHRSYQRSDSRREIYRKKSQVLSQVFRVVRYFA